MPDQPEEAQPRKQYNVKMTETENSSVRALLARLRGEHESPERNSLESGTLTMDGSGVWHDADARPPMPGERCIARVTGMAHPMYFGQTTLAGDWMLEAPDADYTGDVEVISWRVPG